jgi:hypothetical protein
MSFNTAKIINVYYKSDRKPYDANGKPISYFGEDFIGANEATEIRFYMPNEEDLGAVQCAVDVKRANGDKRYDILTKVVAGLETYYKLELNDWYSAYVGKVTIAFKAYKGGITIVDGVITSVTAPVYVSDIFHLQIAYAPNSTEEVPPFDPSDVTTFLSALSAKLNVNNGIFVIASSLPSLVGGVYNGQWFLVKNNADGSLGKLYYINGSTAEEVELNMETLKLTPTGNGDITTNTGKLNWEQPNGTVQLGLYNDVNMEIGEDVFYYGKASATITKGQVIQFGGYQGDHILMKPAVPAEINANPKLIMGIAKHNIANNDFGYVLHFGKLDGVDTGSFVAGNLLYFSSSSINNGELTSTIPTAPNAKILMCAVIKAETSNPSNNGVYQVRINIEPKLGDLQDVNITSVANKNVLRYNSTNSRWENVADLTTAESNILNIEDGTTTVGKALADQNGDVIDTTYLKLATASSTYVPLSSKGVANGVAPLDSSNKIPSIHLPGGVDDIKEFASLANFPLVGEASIIYVALDTNKIYRWSGSAYVEISSSLALGTTNTTAFPGDRGLATETQSNNIVNGTQTLTNTRITNSAVGTSPLIVNGIASTTANLQEWKINNSNLSTLTSAGYFRGTGLLNLTTGSNSRLDMGNNGTLIQRDVNDLTNINPALTINQIQGLGDILRLQSAGANKLEITKDGFINQNGTRLLHTTGTSSVFVGLTSGTLNNTGTNNTGVGSFSLESLTSGNDNVAVGRTALSSLTTSNENVGVGMNGGRSITTGTGRNTFIGFNSGFTGAWGTQLATATNSTAIGYQSYTDKSNQMVFGNASVTEFKFDRNASAVALLPNLTASSSNFHLFERTTTDINTSGAIVSFKRTSSGDMVDGFGSNVAFQIRDNANVDNTISTIRALRSGADNSGRLVFETVNTGVFGEKMTILPDGKVGIGTASPTNTLSILTIGNTDGFQIRRNSTTTNDYALLGFRVTNSEGTTNFAEMRAVRTNRAISGDTDISLHSFTNGSLTEKLRIRDDGLVGINETSPTAQLQVKSGATNRIPLIIDTLASQTANLAEWRVNGSAVGLVASDGLARFPRISNLVTVNNAQLELTNNGAIISRNINDANPALIVNLANSSATGNIQVWQKAGVAVANITDSGYFQTTQGYGSTGSFGLYFTTNANQASVNVASTGITILRNINDANVTLKVRQQNVSATGRLQEWIYGSDVVSSVEKDGIANFTGTPSNAQTVDYTLVLSDKGKVVRINSSSNLTVTIPLNSSVAFPIDTELAILRYGTGTVSISPTSGVTLNSKNSERKISGQYGSVALKKIGTDEWVLVGSLEA